MEGDNYPPLRLDITARLNVLQIGIAECIIVGFDKTASLTSIIIPASAMLLIEHSIVEGGEVSVYTVGVSLCRGRVAVDSANRLK